MNKENYLVTIVVPCYNQAQYLSEALESVLCQTYQNWECIIVNDGSTDHTKVVSLKYTKKDARFTYIEQKNSGLSAARNFGIKQGHGTYILPLDADDRIAPQYIEIAIKSFLSNERLKIVYCRAAYFGRRRGEWHLPSFSLERMLGQNCIFCSAFYKRTDFERVGGYNSQMKGGYEDWDFWLSILEMEGDVFRIDRVLFYYRIRKRSMVRKLDLARIKMLRRKIWENHRDLYAKNFFDVTESVEYNLIFHSIEYKVGSILAKPIRFLYNLLYR